MKIGLAEFRTAVETHLNAHLSTLSGAIYEPVKYVLAVGGKRIRPSLLLASAAAFGGEVDDALDEAAALEIFHNFTLLHDDVMDDADSRRGRPSVHIKWDVSQAILSGDIMFSMSLDLLLKKRGERARDMMRLFNLTATEVCVGQQMDMDFEQRDDVTVDEYLEMIRLKTSVLLGASMGIGAMSAGAEQSDIDAIYAFALNVGMAFQMQDDYLDAFGDMEKVGKRSGGDIIRNKKTILLLNAQTMGTDEDVAAIEKLSVINGKDAEKVEAIKAIMIRSGAVEDVEKRKREYKEAAIKHLESTSLAEENKEVFRQFATEQLSRTY